MNRGAGRQDTFIDDYDLESFISILVAATIKFGIEIHAYCLMPNHYHLLVRSPDGQLSRAMKFIGQSYTQSFNYRHDRDGALFRGRFHSTIVDSDNYLDTVARYIHRNPILDWMEDDSILDTFKWSSLAVYEGRRPKPDWLTTHEVLRTFATDKAYANFVRDTTEDDLPDEVSQARTLFSNPFRIGIVLGDSTFLASLVELAGSTAEKFRPWIQAPIPDRRRPTPILG